MLREIPFIGQGRKMSYEKASQKQEPSNTISIS